MLLNRFNDESNKLPFETTWLSEKFDGIRVFYVPTQGFYSRSGKHINVPDSFISNMPKTDKILDGELFAGYNSLHLVSGLTNKIETPANRWKNIKFYAFDIIELNVPFVTKYSQLLKLSKQKSKSFVLVKQQEVKSFSKADKLYKQIIKKGGEGVVLRDPTKAYEVKKRSRNVLKWKPIHHAEGVIIGYNEGKNKFKGVLGSFQIKFGKDKKFNLSGFTNAMRNKFIFNKSGQLIKQPKNNHKIGDIITFKFMTLSKSGRPREPVYIGQRYD